MPSEDVSIFTELGIHVENPVRATAGQGGAPAGASTCASTPVGDVARELAAAIRGADAILVGAGRGLAIAAERALLRDDSAAARDAGVCDLRAYLRATGIASVAEAMRFPYASAEDMWGFLARYLRVLINGPVVGPYGDLGVILRAAPSLAVTTAADGQVARVASPGSVWRCRGDARLLQCSQPCHDELFDAAPLVGRIAARIAGQLASSQVTVLTPSDLACPSDLVPRCPTCGHVLVPWAGDDLLHGEAWHADACSYRDFLAARLAGDVDAAGDADTADAAGDVDASADAGGASPEARVRPHGGGLLLLELGVARGDGATIATPFWSVASRHRGARCCLVGCAGASDAPVAVDDGDEAPDDAHGAGLLDGVRVERDPDGCLLRADGDLTRMLAEIRAALDATDA